MPETSKFDCRKSQRTLQNHKGFRSQFTEALSEPIRRAASRSSGHVASSSAHPSSTQLLGTFGFPTLSVWSLQCTS